MSMQSEGEDAKGRNYDQVTKDGSSSAASMGTGGTGDVGRMSGEAAAGNAQSDTRTDDLLDRGADQERGQGFRPSQPGAVETGLEGIGNKIGGNPGNRQANPGSPGNQHNDWGHSDVGAGNKQSESRLDDVVGSDTGHFAEEAGDLQTGLGGTESLSTGKAGVPESNGRRNRQ
ncbi:MAG: hypothetical protein ACXU8Z_22065 [Caulobacteraceae bacterium]